MKLTERKREDILVAAIAVFQEHGFSPARVDEIAERAAVSKRTLYKHFESKQGLFDAIVERLVANIGMFTPPEFQPELPVHTQLVTALTDYAKVIASPGYIGLLRLVATEFMRDRGLAQRILNRPEFHVSPVLPILEGAIESGALQNADAETVSAQLLALVKSDYFWGQFMLGADQNHDPAAAEKSVNLILAAYSS